MFLCLIRSTGLRKGYNWIFHKRLVVFLSLIQSTGLSLTKGHKWIFDEDGYVSISDPVNGTEKEM